MSTKYVVLTVLITIFIILVIIDGIRKIQKNRGPSETAADMENMQDESVSE